MTDDEFELAFADDLESAQKFQVWLDTLDEREDLVGEYLRLAFLTETSPPSDKTTRTRLWNRLRQLRTAHATEWFGVKPTEDDWHWGLARGLRLDPTLEALERCLTSRLGRFVTDFSVTGELDGDATRALVQRFARHRCLRGLTLATSRREAVFPMGILPLRRLALRGFSLDDAATMNDGLEALRLEDVTLAETAVEVLSRPAPSLRRLTLDGAPEVTQRVSLRLQPSAHPMLTELSVHVIDADAVLEFVVTSGLIDRLKRLTIDGALTDRGLEVLDAHAPRFAMLETLNLDWTRCSQEGVQSVARRLPNIGTTTRAIGAAAWID